MVMDTRRLCAAIFERSGLAVDEHDPIVAVLAASAEQTEEIGERLLSRTSPVRIAVTVTVAAAIFAAAGTWTGWVLALQRFEAERAEWLHQQSDPRLTALLLSEQGRAGVQLAELGVATLLARCDGRPSWRVQEGYCIPKTPEGNPDGFRVDPPRR
jgi:hypothetical protein